MIHATYAQAAEHAQSRSEESRITYSVYMLCNGNVIEGYETVNGLRWEGPDPMAVFFCGEQQ